MSTFPFSLVRSWPHPQLSSTDFFNHKFPRRGITFQHLTLQSNKTQLSSLGKTVNSTPSLFILLNYCKRNWKKTKKQKTTSISKAVIFLVWKSQSVWWLCDATGESMLHVFFPQTQHSTWLPLNACCLLVAKRLLLFQYCNCALNRKRGNVTSKSHPSQLCWLPF